LDSTRFTHAGSYKQTSIFKNTSTFRILGENLYLSAGEFPPIDRPIKTAENHKLCIERFNAISKQTKAFFLNKEHGASTAF
jgi:hypothetical protein